MHGGVFPYRGFLLPLWLIILLDQTETSKVIQKSNKIRIILALSLQKNSSFHSHRLRSLTGLGDLKSNLPGQCLNKDISRCCKANYEVDWALDAICLGNVLMKIFPLVVKPITKLIGLLMQSVWAMSLWRHFLLTVKPITKLIGRNALCLGDILMKIFPVVVKPITKLIGLVTQFVWVIFWWRYFPVLRNVE